MNSLIETLRFRKTMFSIRFRQILSYLHFSYKNNKQSNEDRLFNVQSAIDYFSRKFEKKINLSQNISVNEENDTMALTIKF